jgi:hypothetical protein
VASAATASSLMAFHREKGIPFAAPRVGGGKVMTPADLRLHKYMLDIEHIHLSDQVTSHVLVGE